MTATDKFRLALVAIAELVFFAGGVALVLVGQTLFGVVMIAVGAVAASIVMALLVLKSRGKSVPGNNETVD